MQVTYGLLEPFSHGRGYQEPVFPANPSAGSGFVYEVEGQWYTRLLLCAFQLSTSDNAADRVVTVTYSTAQGQVYGADGPAVAVEASTTSQQFYGTSERGTSEWNTGTSVLFPLWGGFMPSGSLISLNVANIDTTDQLASIGLLFERFEVGKAGYPIGGMDTSEYRQYVETLSD